MLRELQPLVEKPSTAEATLARFKGKKVAVDLSSWLYKGAYGCCLELCMGRPTTKYVAFVLRRLHTLREHGVEGVLVCDNGATGLKAETQRSRRSNTEARKAEGKRLLALMDKLPKKDYARRKELRKKAEEQFQGCVSITKDMVDAVVKEADKYGFRSIFAPFEADAQLAFLACSGQCAGVVTEDSDLVVYSVVSGISFPLILKMDSVGRAEVLDFDLRRLRQGRDASLESDDDGGGGGGGASAAESARGDAASALQPYAKQPFAPKSFLAQLTRLGWDCAARRMFVQMCVLAGCDYLDSLPGVGLKTAQKHIIQHRKVSADLRVKHIGRKVAEAALKAATKRARAPQPNKLTLARVSTLASLT